MVKDGEDWHGLQTTNLKNLFRLNFSKYTNRDVVPLTYLISSIIQFRSDSPSLWILVLSCFGFLQKLLGSSVDSGLRLFGSAVAGGLDMDSNGYPGTCARPWIFRKIVSKSAILVVYSFLLVYTRKQSTLLTIMLLRKLREHLSPLKSILQSSSLSSCRYRSWCIWVK